MDAELLVLACKVLLGLGVSAALWFGVRPLIAGGSGWGSFAQPFSVTDLPEGERFSSVSGAIGQGMLSAKYRSMWTLVVNAAGFGLSIRSVFGEAPSIFVPWSRVESVVETRIPFIRAAVVQIRGQSHPISLYGPPGLAVARAYARSHAARTV